MKHDHNKIHGLKRIKHSFKSKGHNTLIHKKVVVKQGTTVKRRKVIKHVFKRGKGLVRKVRKIVNIDKNGKRTFKGPYTLVEIENADNDKIIIELDSKDKKHSGEEKFTPIKVIYKLKDLADGKVIQRKIKADLYQVDSKKRFDIDISTLPEGEYQLITRIISHKVKHLDRKRNKKRRLVKFVHFASIDFAREESIEAHLNLIRIDEFKSTVVYDIKGSSADAKSYEILLYENGELASTRSLENVDQPFKYIFTNSDTTYQVELVLTSNSGKVTRVRGDEITPISIAPVLDATITIDETYGDLFHIDFSASSMLDGTALTTFGIIAIKDNEVVEEKYTNTPVFEFSTSARGDIRIIAFVQSEIGTYNTANMGIFNISENVPMTIFLNYSHRFFDESDPQRLYFGFTNLVSEEEFKQFNMSVTNKETGETTLISYSAYDVGGEYLHTVFGVKENGTYLIEVELEFKDGRKSAAYKTEQLFEFDLGVAELNITVIESEESPRHYNLNAAGSSPGTYGWFEERKCSLTRIGSDEVFEVYFGDEIEQFYLQNAGVWQMDCIATTNTGLSVEFNQVINVVNLAPTLEASYTEGSSNRNFVFTAITNDPDGYIVRVVFTAHAPDGMIYSWEVNETFDTTLEPSGLWRITIAATDNDGAVTTKELQVNVINEPPTVKLSHTNGTEHPRGYDFNIASSDTDGFIVRNELHITKPNGEIVLFENQADVGYYFDAAGLWKIKAVAIDNDGATAEEEIILNIENAKPLLELSYTVGSDHPRDRSFSIISSDTDGHIVRNELHITDPHGMLVVHEVGTDYFQRLEAPGTWEIKAMAFDNNEAVTTKELNIVIENSKPSLELSHSIGAENPRDYNFTITSSDSDGYIVRNELHVIDPQGVLAIHEVGTDYFQFFEAVGIWQVKAVALDNNGETTEKELVISVENIKPIANLFVQEIDPANHLYGIHSTFSDVDGYVIRTMLLITDGNGQTEQYEPSDYFEIRLDVAGTYQISLSVQDQDTAWSDQSIQNVTVIANILPELSVIYHKTENENEFLFTQTSSDSDGAVVKVTLNVESPYGETYSKDIGGKTVEQLQIPGLWTLEFVAEDNRGGTAVEIINIQVGNLTPTVDLSLTIGEENPRDYNFALTSSDSDGVISRNELHITNPLGAKQVHEVQNSFFLFLDIVGQWEIKAVAFDNFGASAEKIILINIEEAEISPSYNIVLEGEVRGDEFFGAIQIGVDDIPVPIGNVESFSLNLGDGNTIGWSSSDGTPLIEKLQFIHSYSETGTFTLSSILTTTSGYEHLSPELVLRVGGLKKNIEIPSSFELLVTGIDLNNRNECSLDLQISISDEGIMSPLATHITLNDSSVISNFTQEEGGLFVGSILAKEGRNGLTIKSIDQYGHPLSKELTFTCGSRNLSFHLLDSAGTPVPETEVTLSSGKNSIKAMTDNNGLLVANNIPLFDYMISATSNDEFVSELLLKDLVYTTVTMEGTGTVSEDNSGLKSGLVGWIHDEKYVRFVDGVDRDELRVSVPKGESTVFSHTFKHTKNQNYLSINSGYNILADTHSVVVTLVNHTTSEMSNSFIDLNNLRDLVSTVGVSNGDLVTYRVNVLSKVNQSSSVFNKFNIINNAYAFSGVDIYVSPSVLLPFDIKLELLDLESSHKDEDESAEQKRYRLTKLEQFSVGEYIPGKNKIYTSFKVRSFNNTIKLSFEDVLIKQGESVLSVAPVFSPEDNLIRPVGTNDYHYFYNSIKGLETEDGYHIEQDSLSSFIPFLKVPSNTFNTDSDIIVDIAVVARDEADNFIGTRIINVVIKKEDILINHGIQAGPNHYLHSDNNNNPDYGDDWSRPLTKKVLNEIISLGPGYSVGDVSNINGSKSYFKNTEEKDRTYFQPHNGHNDGLRFDLQTPHFNKGDGGFDAEGIRDLLKMVDSSDLFRENLSYMAVSFNRSDNAKIELLKHSCVAGQTIQEIVSWWPAHNTHFHFNLRDGRSPGGREISLKAQDERPYVGHLRKDPGRRDDSGATNVFRFTVEGLAMDGMIQVFKVLNTGKSKQVLGPIYTKKIDADSTFSKVVPDGVFTIKRVSKTEYELHVPVNTDLSIASKYSVVVTGINRGASSGRKDDSCFSETIELSDLKVEKLEAERVSLGDDAAVTHVTIDNSFDTLEIYDLNYRSDAYGRYSRGEYDQILIDSYVSSSDLIKDAKVVKNNPSHTVFSLNSDVAYNSGIRLKACWADKCFIKDVLTSKPLLKPSRSNQDYKWGQWTIFSRESRQSFGAVNQVLIDYRADIKYKTTITLIGYEGYGEDKTIEDSYMRSNGNLYGEGHFLKCQVRKPNYVFYRVELIKHDEDGNRKSSYESVEGGFTRIDESYVFEASFPDQEINLSPIRLESTEVICEPDPLL